MKYVIHAYEQSYGGLHGIEDWRAVYYENLSQVEQEATEMSINVMESYSFIQEDLDQQACFYAGCDMIDAYETEEENEAFIMAREDAINENVAYTIWEVNEDCEFSILEINRMLANDPDGFVNDFCTIIVGY